MLCSTGSMEMRRAGLRSTLTSDLVVWRLVRVAVRSSSSPAREPS
jgi:hypothetical protein